MTESLFLYSSAYVYKMAKNVYPVNKNVTIDDRGKGTIIGHKNKLCVISYLSSCDKNNRRGSLNNKFLELVY